MITVAIDGPSGAGKSTLSRLAAQRLGYIYVDTGALYRAIGLYAAQKGVDASDKDKVTGLLPALSLELVYTGQGQRILLDGVDVSEEIRSPEMSLAASRVSAHPEVREYLLELQRGMAEKNNVIMDGRDIGTVVLPGATVKIFLTASLEARAGRRHAEYIAKGQKVSYNDILEDMRQRDERDSSRAVAPLKQAEDAVLLDTSALDFEQSLEAILQIIGQEAL